MHLKRKYLSSKVDVVSAWLDWNKINLSHLHGYYHEMRENDQNLAKVLWQKGAKILFCNCSLDPKQLSLFCLLRLISASADRIDYISNFCSMIELFHELKNSFFQHKSIQEFDNVSAAKKVNQTFVGRLHITTNWKFSCLLHAHSQFLCSFARFDLANRGMCQPVQVHTFNARLLVFDKTSAQHHFAAVNCSDAVMSVFYFPVLMLSLIFLQLWTDVSWRWSYFPPMC